MGRLVEDLLEVCLFVDMDMGKVIYKVIVKGKSSYRCKVMRGMFFFSFFSLFWVYFVFNILFLVNFCGLLM